MVLKRTHLHIIFWLVYFLIDFTLDVLAVTDLKAYERIPVHRIMWMSFMTGLITVPVKGGFCYLLLYCNRFLKSKAGLTMLFILFFIAMVIARQVIIKYVLTPIVFLEPEPLRPHVFTPNRIVSAVMDILLVLSLFTCMEFYLRQIAFLRRENEVSKQKFKSELNFLKEQVNPHFLFNTLNNIFVLARKQSRSAPDAVMRLSSILRFTLYETMRNRILLAAEVGVIEAYIELQRLRYDDDVVVLFEKEINGQSPQVTPLLLLPLVENAFKHGIREAGEKSFINIRLHLDGSNLEFSIYNSRCKRLTVSSRQIGLSNVKRRLELTYTDHRFTIVDDLDTFTVLLFINLDSYEEI